MFIAFYLFLFNIQILVCFNKWCMHPLSCVSNLLRGRFLQSHIRVYDVFLSCCESECRLCFLAGSVSVRLNLKCIQAVHCK